MGLGIKNVGCFVVLSPVCCFSKKHRVGLLWFSAGKSVVFKIVLLLGRFLWIWFLSRDVPRQLGFQT